MASRRIQCVRACLVAVALGSASLSARQLPTELTAAAGPTDRVATFITTHERYQPADGAAVDLTIVSKSGAADRASTLATETKRALTLMDEWVGPLAAGALTVVDAPWNSRLSGVYGNTVVVRSRWIAPARDRSLERQLIAGVARWYFPGRGDAFVDGVVLFTAGRAIDTLLEGSQFHTDRYVGNFLPYPLRALSLSPLASNSRPRLRRFDELSGGDPAAERAARALDVAERFLGWPAVQQALSAFRETGGGSLSDFVRIATVQRGHDVSWLFADAMRAGASFDYALTALDVVPAAGQFDVRLTIERRGDAVFARSLPVETRFADGTVVRDTWDPRQPRSTIAYASASPAVSSAIDPDVILVLDQTRSNNVINLQPQPWSRLGLKLACDWAIWLQNAMLAYSGIV